MADPTMHALFDGSDHGLIPGGAAERARHLVTTESWFANGHLRSDYMKALAALLAEHEALLQRVSDAEVVQVDSRNRAIDALRSAGYYRGQRVRILAEVE